MRTQLNNAQKKLAELQDKAKETGVPINLLQVKLDFDKAFRGCGDDAQKKATMIKAWGDDKGCKNWHTQYSSTLSRMETEKASGSQGWISRLLSALLVSAF